MEEVAIFQVGGFFAAFDGAFGFELVGAQEV